MKKLLYVIIFLSVLTIGTSAIAAEASTAEVMGMFLLVLVGLVVVIALYILPSIIAFKRMHKNRMAILCLDLLTAWSFLGWVACVVWAFTDNCEEEIANGIIK